MADIALRDYLTEVDTLIEGNSYDEAISHCRHILGAYPKCLEVYRLLGKAALEKEDDKAAIDIFQRVLSVDPEDFVARVGLSIVHDRQGNLDDALWQMERGFELMPSNDVIQSELRRLYGRRDGIEPARIALTRGALARMYAHGDLHDEAIAEIRALLRDSPGRIDLQVLLAETLWRDEQRNEAASVAERILDDYPNCLPANLILGEIWLNSGFAEDGEMLLRRAQALDPDNQRAVALLGSASPLNEQSATITRLEYQSQGAAAAEPVSEQIPEWLAGLAGLTLEKPESAELPGLPEPSPGPAIELPASSEGLPDWLTGLEYSTPEAEQPTADQEMPDWLKAPDAGGHPGLVSGIAAGVAAAAAADWLSDRGGETEPPEQEPAEPVPDWLVAGAAAAAPPESAEPAAEPAPDWLAGISEPTPAAPGLGAPAPAPDWLSDLGAPAEQAPAPSGLEQVELPDWLQAMRPEETTPTPPGLSEVQAGDVTVEPAEISDWMPEAEEAPSSDAALEFLQRLGEGVQVEPPAPEVLALEGEIPSSDDALAFLSGLTAEKEEEIRAEAEARMAQFVGGEEAVPPAAEPERPEFPSMPGAGLAAAGAALGMLGARDEEEPPVEAAPPAAAPAQPPLVLDEMPSPDDALAFLQSLTVGKEEELRAQAEQEGEARMDAIMGGKPGTSPLKPRPEAAEAAPVQPPPVPTDKMLSPDEALAFLASLTVGKEEELRAEAERAGEERMDAIMGGKPGTSPLRPRAEPQPAEEAPEPAAEEALAFLADLTQPIQAEVAAPVAGAPVEEVQPAAEVMGFWLQTAEDEGVEAIPPDYFERAQEEPAPAAPAVPAAEAPARRGAARAQPQPEPSPPSAPVAVPTGAEEFQARLEADPADHESRLGLARVWWAAGDRDQALGLYQALVEESAFLSEVAGDLRRNLETFESAAWYRTLGDAHMKLGNMPQALDAYRQALAHL